MAVFLYPHYKMSWFKRHWCADEIKKARCYIDSQYLIAKAASTTTQQQPAMPVIGFLHAGSLDVNPTDPAISSSVSPG